MSGMTKQELVEELKKIGLKEGMEIEVHSSLSSLGYVEGGAETVIEALMECVTDRGSIFMPSLCYGPELELTQEDKDMGITVKIKILPEDESRTAMGIIADTFRQRDDVMPKEINDMFAPTEEAGNKYPEDEWLVECGEPSVKPWYTIQDMAYQKGIIKEGYIGKCKYMFFDIWDVVSLYRKELETNPFELYGLDRKLSTSVNIT